MKIFRYFITKFFFKRAMLVFSVLFLLFLSNFLLFIAARSTVSTLQGYHEIKRLNQDNAYIANPDPDSEHNPDMDRDDTQAVYDYLHQNQFRYALFTDGFMVELSNNYDKEVSCEYLNEEYYQLNPQFEVSQGTGLYFDYQMDDCPEIPVLIGKGLSETYPLGSQIELVDPGLLKPVKLKVQGILKDNISHANLLSLSSKEYYNFSIIIPVNEAYINQADIGIQYNALFNMVLLQVSREDVDDFAAHIQNTLGRKYNFFTQEENFKYFNEYFVGSLQVMLTVTAVLLLLLFCMAVWSSLSSIRLMIKDFTINLFVGLRYSKLRKILYGYYGLLFLGSMIALFAIAAYTRMYVWMEQESLLCTFGLFGLIEMDWISLCTVGIFNLLLGVVLVEIMMWRIKKIPISLGVLQ